MEQRLRAALGDAHIVYTDCLQEAEAAIQSGLAQGCAALVVGGGDGAVNHAVNLGAGEKAPLSIVPLGAANDLARALEVPALPALAVGGGRRRRIDVLQVNGRRFCTVGGIGLPADIARHVNQLKQGPRARRLLGLLGTTVYSLVSARHVLLSRQLSGRVHITYQPPGGAAQEQRELEAHGVFIANQASLGGGLTVCPTSRHDDGVFEICVLPARSRVALASVLLRLVSQVPVPETALQVVRATSARFRCEQKGWFFGDGESLAEGSLFEVTLHPQALEVAC